jgi:hypothetical protein
MRVGAAHQLENFCREVYRVMKEGVSQGPETYSVGGWEIEWNPAHNSSAVVEARKNGGKVALLETDIEDRVAYSEKTTGWSEVEGRYAESREAAYRLVGDFMHELDYHDGF